jgi:hypothetical protein
MSILVIIAFIGFVASIFLFTKGPYAMKPPEAPELPPVAPLPIDPVTMPTKPEILYQKAYDCLGTHQTLNPSVPNEVGCGEAWSSVAKKAGVEGIPPLGYAGTANLYLWLKSNPAFLSVPVPEAGDTIISPTGYGNGSVRGHVGIVGKHHIMSNNSDTGLFSDHWKLEEWRMYYGLNGGLPIAFFRWIG